MFAEELIHLWVVVFAAFLIIIGMIAMLKTLAPHLPSGLAQLLAGV